MNAEYLLDAIGRLDDDLLREAERYRRPKARYGRLVGLAASFAVVILLGYGVTHLGMGGGANTSGGGNGTAPASGNSAPSGGSMLQGGYSGAPRAEDGADAPGEAAQSSDGDWTATSSGRGPEVPGTPGAYGDASPGLGDKLLSISVWMDEPMNRLWYTFFHYYNEDRILDELPEGCVELGRLESLSVTEEHNVPYTDSEEYVGCPVWLLRTDPVQKEFKLYVELPEGGYLECR